MTIVAHIHFFHKPIVDLDIWYWPICIDLSQNSQHFWPHIPQTYVSCACAASSKCSPAALAQATHIIQGAVLTAFRGWVLRKRWNVNVYEKIIKKSGTTNSGAVLAARHVYLRTHRPEDGRTQRVSSLASSTFLCCPVSISPDGVDGG